MQRRFLLITAILGMLTLLLTIFRPDFSSVHAQQDIMDSEPTSVSSGATLPTDFFPIGVYDYLSADKGRAMTMEEFTGYYDQEMQLLERYHINTVVMRTYEYNNDDRTAEVPYRLAVLDKALEHDIRVIMSVGNPINPDWDHAGPDWPFDVAYTHPAILAYKLADEPLHRENHPPWDEIQVAGYGYRILRQFYPDVPIITVLVGEDIDADGGGMDSEWDDEAIELGYPLEGWAVRWWQELDSDVKAIRNYHMRRTYNMVDFYPDQNRLPLDEAFRVYEEDLLPEKPWWFVIATFGIGTLEKDDAAYWRFPTESEVIGQAHLALAHGARGILAYSLQPYSTNQVFSLTDQDLELTAARDGSYPMDGLGYIGQITSDHAELLLRHQVNWDMQVKSSSLKVAVVPRIDPVTGTEYVYVVNMDTDNPASAEITIQAAHSIRSARDIYTGNPVLMSGDTAVSVQLTPGEGQFWELTPGAD